MEKNIERELFQTELYFQIIMTVKTRVYLLLMIFKNSAKKSIKVNLFHLERQRHIKVKEFAGISYIR